MYTERDKQVIMSASFFFMMIYDLVQMACQMCLTAAVFVVIMLLCWSTRDTNKKSEPDTNDQVDDAKTKYVLMDSTANQVMKPPIVGPPLGEYQALPANRFEARKFMELPRGGLSCPNKRWYDAIYNGGAETILEEPTEQTGHSDTMYLESLAKRDVQSLWKEDANTRRRETRAWRMAPQPTTGMMV